MSTTDARAVANARDRAARAGLQLARDFWRADTFTLRDGHGTILAAGDLAAVSAALRDRRYGTNQPPAAWWVLIDDYMLTLAAAGQPRATRTLRSLNPLTLNPSAPAH